LINISQFRCCSYPHLITSMSPLRQKLFPTSLSADILEFESLSISHDPSSPNSRGSRDPRKSLQRDDVHFNPKGAIYTSPTKKGLRTLEKEKLTRMKAEREKELKLKSLQSPTLKKLMRATSSKPADRNITSQKNSKDEDQDDHESQNDRKRFKRSESTISLGSNISREIVFNGANGRGRGKPKAKSGKPQIAKSNRPVEKRVIQSTIESQALVLVESTPAKSKTDKFADISKKRREDMDGVQERIEGEKMNGTANLILVEETPSRGK